MSLTFRNDPFPGAQDRQHGKVERAWNSKVKFPLFYLQLFYVLHLLGSGEPMPNFAGFDSDDDL